MITGSISAHRSSVKSLGYRLRSLTGLSKHGQARRPAVTPQIHLITQRQDGHKLTNSPLSTDAPIRADIQRELAAVHAARLSRTQASQPQQPCRPRDVSGLTVSELERTRRELAANLALVRPDSPARVPILAHISAIDTELAGRTGQQP